MNWIPCVTLINWCFTSKCITNSGTITWKQVFPSPQQPYKLKLTTTTQPTTVQTTIRSADTTITIIVTFVVNNVSSLKIIRQILQSSHNPVYPTIFILIHNLITYTTLCTNHLKSDKNTITVTKYPPKLPENQSNQRTSIHRHFKVKCPKNLQQKLSRKTETMKFNSIMEELDKSDGNGNQSKNNTNHFATIYESDNGEGN